MAGTGTRSLKLTLLADIDSLKKSLTQGSDEVQSFGSKVSDFGKKAAAAFAVVGVAAVAASIDMVKNAAADEAAQRTLAKTLENTTSATRSQIAAVEDYITKTSLAKGITDDELRPALARLSRSTKDVEEAQKLLSLAMDISSATGKPLEAISNSLGKAYDGNTNALGKLGLGIDQSILKTKDFNLVYDNLRTTFAGFSEQEANTFEGKLRRLQIAFDEGKETIGSYILTAVTPMVELIVNNVVPAIQSFSTNLGEKLAPALENIGTFFSTVLIPIFQSWWAFISDILIPGIIDTFQPILAGLQKAFGYIADSIQKNSDKLAPFFTLIQAIAKFILSTLAPALGTVLGAALTVIGKAISVVIDLFARLVGIINSAVDAIRSLVSFVKNNPLVAGIGNVIDNVFGGGRAVGGPVIGGTSYLVGERGPEIFTPSGSGSITPNNRLGGSTTINLNVTGAIDPEGTARSIINVLNNSYYRGTNGAAALVF
jgi:phage-related protein